MSSTVSLPGNIQYIGLLKKIIRIIICMTENHVPGFHQFLSKQLPTGLSCIQRSKRCLFSWWSIYSFNKVTNNVIISEAASLPQ
jgi:hypothetical protein